MKDRGKKGSCLKCIDGGQVPSACSHGYQASAFFRQLRVVRAFKSTLEDFEEKRSIHSFHSLHSIRSSRSQQGQRPLSAELDITSSKAAPSVPVEQNGAYTNPEFSMQENSFKSNCKSRSVENVTRMSSEIVCDNVGVGSIVAYHGSSYSTSDINLKTTETTI